MNVPRRGGDDARCHGAAEAERIADREHPVAHLRLIRISPNGRRQRCLWLDFKKCEIAQGVATDDFGLQSRVVGQGHGYLLGVGDDMIVGDDQTGRIDDEPRAERGDPGWRRIWGSRCTFLAKKVAEELVEWRSRAG